MATFRRSILGGARPETAVPMDLVSNQITSATLPSVGAVGCYVFTDGGTDIGIYGRFSIPNNYVGTPLVVAKGVLDGTPGASEVLAVGFRKRAVADNEAADGTFDAEQINSITIGSSGTNHANEDLIEITVTLTGADYAVGDEVFFYFFLDASVNTYAGNFLLTALEFQYADA
jgi:hypothetical protein